MKPGLARVNAEDVIPLSPTLDFVGPLARSVVDAALLLQPIFVKSKSEPDVLPAKKSTLRPASLGVPREFFLEVVDPEVQSAFQSAINVLEKCGARMQEISIPQLAETEEAGNVIAWAEATMYHQEAGWYPGHAREYSEDVYKRLEMGEKVSAVSYLKARALREKFKEQLLEVFASNDLDALMVPTTPMVAPRIGEDSVSIQGKTYPTRALLLRLNRPANLAGFRQFPCRAV